MITMTTNAKELTSFIGRMQTNIMRSQTELVTRLAIETKQLLEINAPSWEGTLKKKVVMKVFKKLHKGEVMMASPLYDMIAQQNEFNTKGKRKLYKSAYPKLERWANSKGIFLDKPYVVVGGTNTRLGRKNKFFEPTFYQIQSRVPQVAMEVFARAIMRTGA